MKIVLRSLVSRKGAQCYLSSVLLDTSLGSRRDVYKTFGGFRGSSWIAVCAEWRSLVHSSAIVGADGVSISTFQCHR